MPTSPELTAGRSVFFAVLGAAALALKGHYSGPRQELVHSYGGNVAASFAVYFVVSNLRLPPSIVGLDVHLRPHPWYTRLLMATAALVVVELFEVTNGFGVMTNTYDRLDLVANACGVAFAVAVDAFTPNRRPTPPTPS